MNQELNRTALPSASSQLAGALLSAFKHVVKLLYLRDEACVTVLSGGGGGSTQLESKRMENSPKPVEPPLVSLLRVLATNEARRLLRNAAMPFKAPVEPTSVSDLSPLDAESKKMQL